MNFTDVVKIPDNKVLVNSAWNYVRTNCYKIGDMVFFNIAGYCTSYIANHDYVFAEIDEGESAEIMDFLGHRTDETGNLTGFHKVAVMNQSGNAHIYANPSSTSGGWWYASGWYRLN